MTLSNKARALAAAAALLALPAAAPASSQAAPVKRCGTMLGYRVYASRTTSCPFARNTLFTWRESSGGSFFSYSPTTDRWYLMRCRLTHPGVTCWGGNGARVWAY